jgi:hypothetical protein
MPWLHLRLFFPHRPDVFAGEALPGKMFVKAIVFVK